MISVRAGARVEWVALFAFDGVPIVNVVARAPPDDAALARILMLARGLSCAEC